MAYTASEVRNTCHANNMHVSRYDGEWRITPNEVQGTAKGERVAYYTDDNEDAICTAIAMRRTFSRYA